MVYATFNKITVSEREILEAICRDDRAAVKKLLKADASLAQLRVSEAQLFQDGISHWIYEDDTPLHLAAAGYRVEIVELLLASGADPNAAHNHRRGAPLHYAADSARARNCADASDQIATIRSLLKAGAAINAQDKNGATPLHRAVRTRGAAATKCLLDAGADPLLKNNPGSTPFHLAVQNTGHGGTGSDVAKSAQAEIIKDFISRGISKRIRDGKGKSVLDCAKSGWIRETLGGGAG